MLEHLPFGFFAILLEGCPGEVEVGVAFVLPDEEGVGGVGEPDVVVLDADAAGGGVSLHGAVFEETMA